MSTPIIILAAGSSSRLGQPKQLVQFGEKNLLETTIAAAKEAALHPIIVVTGSDQESILEKIQISDVVIERNHSWEKGMGNSLKAGIMAVMKICPDAENLLISVCDQPEIKAENFLNLIKERSSSGKAIIASFYAGVPGVPSLFSKEYFPELLSLGDDEGARKLFGPHKKDLSTVPFPGGEIDIDTPEQLQAYSSGKN